ncbi:MAG: isoprenyl transferase [Lachnospiraceae bacterium]|nr:isoprenyl transferase [Lachnospiraceae bacterium]MBQ9233447.1 isoprenyl transferase [Lachnospiraceae bacterium]
MEKVIDGEELNVPNHVAIILDGNGRWAKKRLMPRNYGHKIGAKTLEKVCEDAKELGIKYLTVYAFSTENWKRSVEEVSGIMNILRDYLKICIDSSEKNKMRVRIIGDRSALDDDIVKKIEELEEVSSVYDELYFTIAINYGGRDDIRRGIKKLISDVNSGKTSEDITEDIISSYLDTSGIPDPDLLIRTSGEERLSNFLIWQLAYTEFYFTDCLWPDFNMDELKKAVRYYNGRDRRFGGVK